MKENEKIMEGKINRERNYKPLLYGIMILIFISILVSCGALFTISQKLNEIVGLLKNSNQQITNLAATAGRPPSDISLKIGEKAPPFNMVSLDGKNYSLDQFKNKKKVILMAWTPTCAHCEPVLSELEKFYRDTNKKEIAVISVARGATDNEKKEINNKVKKYKLSFPVLLSAADDAFGSNYKIRAVPTMLIIGKTGLIEGVYIGKENISPILQGGRL